jgi:hypothetical protein
MERVAIFWDIGEGIFQELATSRAYFQPDSCPVPQHLTGYEAVNSIRGLAYTYGSATTFKVYLNPSNMSARSQIIRQQFESSGLALVEHTQNDEQNTATHSTMIGGSSQRIYLFDQ